MAKSRSNSLLDRVGQVGLYAKFAIPRLQRASCAGLLSALLLWGIVVVLGGCVSSPDRTGIHLKAGIGGLLSEIVDLSVEVDIATSKNIALPEADVHECNILCRLFGCPAEAKPDSVEPIE